MMIISMAAAGMLIYILVYKYQTKKKIRHLIELMERLNEGDYSIDWNAMKEGDYGILQNELYKTTVKLREAADRERIDKKQVKDALADISHQIKTPLTTIRLGLEEIGENNLSEDRNRMILRRMRRSCDHISELVSMVLKLSKLETNAVEFHKKHCSTTVLVESAIDRIEALADLKEVELVVDEKDDTEIFVDPEWQIEAISNILKNCIEHSPNGECVEVNVSKNPMYVRIQISDHGGGISEYELPHIFERFYRGKSANVDQNRDQREDMYAGIGIGLALAKEVVTAEKGMLFARNNAEGMVFEIRYMI